MVFVVAKMRDVSVINRMKRRNICWIIESLFMQVDFFFTFLMIVVSLCHSKMLQLSADVSEDTSACVCLMTARSFDFCCWHFCYLYCDSTNRALFVGKPLLFTECLRSIVWKVCWTLFVECFSVVSSVWLISCVSAISKQLFLAFDPR